MSDKGKRLPDADVERLRRLHAAGATAVKRIIDEVQESDVDLSNDWLYAWGDLPTTLDGLKQRLKSLHIDVEAFKNSARYEANYDRFPWLKDL